MNNQPGVAGVLVGLGAMGATFALSAADAVSADGKWATAAVSLVVFVALLCVYATRAGTRQRTGRLARRWMITLAALAAVATALCIYVVAIGEGPGVLVLAIGLLGVGLVGSTLRRRELPANASKY